MNRGLSDAEANACSVHPTMLSPLLFVGISSTLTYQFVISGSFTKKNALEKASALLDLLQVIKLSSHCIKLSSHCIM